MREARLRTAAAVALAAVALSGALAPGAYGAPFASGRDTREVGKTPNVVFEGPVTVRPGEPGAVVFSITNRYNDTMQAVRFEYAFSVGGDWLFARNLSGNSSDPAFRPVSRLPGDLAPGAALKVVANFTTAASTPPGVYLVSLIVRFSYAGPNGTTTATLASLGSIEPSRRQLVNMSNYNGTLDALGLDGIVPDSSIQVDAGQALGLWWGAAAFGVAVVGAGVAYGLWGPPSRAARGRGK
ncbi:MAG TPA: hypothetical protein VJ547_06635 [Candidatus Thermoplasmatota archaeon]|nr:hypothetical protein [Candidatus Thermoplasmatota archaeon]